jgi:lysozyme
MFSIDQLKGLASTKPTPLASVAPYTNAKHDPRINKQLAADMSKGVGRHVDKSGKQVTDSLKDHEKILTQQTTVLKSISGLLDKQFRYQKEKDLKTKPQFQQASWSSTNNLGSGLYIPPMSMMGEGLLGGLPGFGGIGGGKGKGGRGGKGGARPVPTGSGKGSKGRPGKTSPTGSTRGTPTTSKGPVGRGPSRSPGPAPRPAPGRQAPPRNPRPVRTGRMGGRLGGLITAGSTIAAWVGLDQASNYISNVTGDYGEPGDQTKGPASNMKLSPRGSGLIKKWEGLRLNSYYDTAGVITVGYGHTGPDVYPGQTIDEPTANALFDEDVVEAESAVQSMVQVPVSQSQFDALTSFTFNLGAGKVQDSTLIRKLNAGDYAGAEQEFKRWKYAGGKESEGLINRREDETAMFAEGNDTWNVKTEGLASTAAVAGTAALAMAPSLMSGTSLSTPSMSGATGFAEPVRQPPNPKMLPNSPAALSSNKPYQIGQADTKTVPQVLSKKPRTRTTTVVRPESAKATALQTKPAFNPKLNTPTTPKLNTPTTPKLKDLLESKERIQIDKSRFDKTKPTVKSKPVRTGGRLAGATPLLGLGLEGMYLKDVLADETLTDSEKAKEVGKSGSALLGAEAGAIAGATALGTAGTFVAGPIGTAVGGAIGGVAGGLGGYFAGSEYGGQAIDWANQKISDADLTDAVGRAVAVPMSLFSEEARETLATDFKNNQPRIEQALTDVKTSVGTFFSDIKNKVIGDKETEAKVNTDLASKAVAGSADIKVPATSVDNKGVTKTYDYAEDDFFAASNKNVTKGVNVEPAKLVQDMAKSGDTLKIAAADTTTVKKDLDKNLVTYSTSMTEIANTISNGLKVQAGQPVSNISGTEVATSPIVRPTAVNSPVSSVQATVSDDDFFASSPNTTKSLPSVTRTAPVVKSEPRSIVDSTPRTRHESIKTVRTEESRVKGAAPLAVQNQGQQLSASFKPKIEDTPTIISDSGLVLLNTGIV